MMFIYAEIYTSVGKMKPQASHVIVDYRVPNASVMFAHLGGTPKLRLKASMST